jgi:hypothetical protein
VRTKHSIAVLLLIGIVCFQFQLATVSSSSPPFPRQGIVDPPDDWFLKKSNSNYFAVRTPDGGRFTAINANDMQQCLNDSHKKISFPDIAAVSYVSDGKTLNAVLWLSSPFKEPRLNGTLHSPSSLTVMPWHAMGFTMSIDVLSAYDTGTDYYLEIAWDVFNGSWTRTLSEGSPTGEKRILEQEQNYTGFFEYGKSYLLMSVNLSEISSPDQYRVLFSAWDNFLNQRRFCTIVDITNWIFVPPPEFIISTLPTSSILRPGEDANIELKVKSAANLKSYVFLTADKTDGVELNFVPSRVYVPQYGTTTSLLHIKASQDAEVRSYTLPISANIIFSTEAKLRNSTTGVNNSLFGSIRENLDLDVDVIKPLTFEERLNSFYTLWFTPITGMYAAIFGIIAGIMPWILTKYKRIKRDKGKESAPEK